MNIDNYELRYFPASGYGWHWYVLDSSSHCIASGLEPGEVEALMAGEAVIEAQLERMK